MLRELRKLKNNHQKVKVRGDKQLLVYPLTTKKLRQEEFRKAAIYQRAKKNPNVKTGVDDKGQVKVTARQKTRKQAKARTAKANRARTRQNAKARAQASAYNRQLKGGMPKSAKQRAQDAAVKLEELQVLIELCLLDSKQDHKLEELLQVTELE